MFLTYINNNLYKKDNEIRGIDVQHYENKRLNECKKQIDMLKDQGYN